MARDVCIPVIMYHCVNDALEASPHGRLGFTPGQFRAHLRWLRGRGYDLVSVSELWNWLLAGAPTGLRPAVITFDDGFRDNLTVAAPIMCDLDARGTVFANPDVTPDSGGSAGSGPWGYLSRAEIRELADGGILEIQSHTWDHLRVFTGPQVVDAYDRSRFDELWWLVWLVRPELRRQWDGDVRRHAGAVPDGYPVFANGRHLVSRRFEPSATFVERCIAGHAEGRSAIGTHDPEGVLEAPAEYEARCRHSLAESRSVLAGWAGRPVEHLCFPGGAYDEQLLRWAAAAGYRTYMLSSREQGRNDASLLQAVQRGGAYPVGLKRLSLTQDYPTWLRTPLVARWVAAFKIGALEGLPWARHGHLVLRRIRDLLP
ncbi:MAG: polysaccharide deacetylase family protein [Candidatus Krumholzibacteriia bacterium]